MIARILDILGTRLEIEVFSVFSVPTCPGNLYLEASSPAAILSLLSLLPAWWTRQRGNHTLVPLDDRVPILTLPPEETIEVGAWLRVRRGLFKGDLACFYGLDNNVEDHIIAWVIPRVLPKKQKNILSVHSISRPVAELFDLDRARARFGQKRIKLLPEGGFECGKLIFRSGLLRLTRPRSHFDTQSVKPSIAEMRQFISASSWLKAHSTRFQGSSIFSAPKNSTHLEALLQRNSRLRRGDNVIIVDGEQRGVTGQILSIENDSAFLCPGHDELNELTKMTVRLVSIRPYYRIGDQVKVIRGLHINVCGFVTFADIVFSQLTVSDSRSNQEVPFCVSDILFKLLTESTLDTGCIRGCRALPSGCGDDLSDDGCHLH